MAFSRANSGITSPVKIIANIFISFIGAGLLGLPYAFKESGIVEGAVIMSLVGYLSVSAMLMIIDCKYAILANGKRTGGKSISLEHSGKVPLIGSGSSDDDMERVSHSSHCDDLTYGDVGFYAFGKGGKRLVDIAIIISQIGFCCGYLIYLCETLVKHIEGLTRGQWLFLLLPPLYLLTLMRHLNKLAVFSLFAQVSNVFALAVVFWFDFSHTEEVPFHPKELSLRGLPFFFAVAIYCYEGAGMILSLEGSVSVSKKPVFRSVFVGTMVALTVLYITFGASGYLSFGPHTLQIITLNLPHGESVVDFAALVKIFLGISLFFTYPMMLFPVTHLVDKTFHWQKEYTKGNLMRLCLVLVTGLVVTAIPSFAVLASLIGATCCTTLAFILPAAFHTKIFRNRLTKRQRIFNTVLIVLGSVGTVVSLIDAVNRIQETPIHHEELAHQDNSALINSPNRNASLSKLIGDPSSNKLKENLENGILDTNIDGKYGRPSDPKLKENLENGILDTNIDGKYGRPSDSKLKENLENGILGTKIGGKRGNDEFKLKENLENGILDTKIDGKDGNDRPKWKDNVTITKEILDSHPKFDGKYENIDDIVSPPSKNKPTESISDKTNTKLLGKLENPTIKQKFEQDQHVTFKNTADMLTPTKIIGPPDTHLVDKSNSLKEKPSLHSANNLSIGDILHIPHTRSDVSKINIPVGLPPDINLNKTNLKEIVQLKTISDHSAGSDSSTMDKSLNNSLVHDLSENNAYKSENVSSLIQSESILTKDGTDHKGDTKDNPAVIISNEIT